MHKSKEYFNALINAVNDAPHEEIFKAISVIKNAIEESKTIFTCGNGGSALTASHYVTDWTKMAWVNKKYQFKALCLNDNIGMLTAYANDLSYEDIFRETLRSYASKDDVLIAVSGSGNSSNVLNAVNAAKDIGLTSIGIVGFDGGQLKNIVDICVHFNVNDMQISEDLHLSFGHIVMKELCGDY